jgi:hypothetical protein
VNLSNQHVKNLETLRRHEAQRWRVNISLAAAPLSVKTSRQEVFSDISKYGASTLTEASLTLEKEVAHDGKPTK